MYGNKCLRVSSLVTVRFSTTKPEGTYLCFGVKTVKY